MLGPAWRREEVVIGGMKVAGGRMSVRNEGSLVVGEEENPEIDSVWKREPVQGFVGQGLYVHGWR